MKFRKVKDPPNFVFWHYEIVDSVNLKEVIEKWKTIT